MSDVVRRPGDIRLRKTAAGHGNAVEDTAAAIVYMGESLDCPVSPGSSRVRLRLHPSSTGERNRQIRLGMHASTCRALIGIDTGT